MSKLKQRKLLATRSIKKAALFIISFIFLCGMVLSPVGFNTKTVHAAVNFYISPTGNDTTGTGTLANPWQTLDSHPTASINPGDTVYVRGGTYTNQKLSPKSGTSTAYITYKAYAGEVPILTGAPSGKPSLDASGTSYIIFDGFKVTNVNEVWINVWQSHHIIFRNLDLSFQNGNTNGVYVGGSVGNYSHHITFQDSVMHDVWNTTKSPNVDRDIIHVENADYNIFERLDLTKGPHSTIFIKDSNYNIIRNNNLHNTWQKAVDIWNTSTTAAGRHLIQNNQFYDNAEAPNDANKGGFGVQLSSSDSIVRNNSFYNNKFYGIILDTYANGGGGSDAPIAVNNRIYNNVFADNGKSTNSVPRSGIVITDWSSGFNNSGNIIKNNAFYDNSNVGVYVDPAFTATRFQTIDGNSIYNPSLPLTALYMTGTGQNSVAYFQTNFGTYVKNNLASDPLFTNAAARDYTAQNGSPLIDAGQNLTTTVGAGTNSSTLVVADARYFFDGFGIVNELGDEIIIGTAAPVRITNVNISNNTLTLASPRTWTNGNTVNLTYVGNAPDIGKYDRAVSGTPTPTPTPTPSPSGVNRAAGIVPTFNGTLGNPAWVTNGVVSNVDEYADSWGVNQWIQIDLGASYNIDKVKMVRYWSDARAYHDVIVQLSNSATFASGITTVFNNDTDNSAGQGTGSQAEYAETSAGKTVTFAPVNARYARFWSSGNTVPGNVGNHTIELEVWSTGATPTPTPTPTPLPSLNRAAGITPTFNGTLGNPAWVTNGVVTNVDEYADSWGVNQWIQIDLGASYNINKVKMVRYWSDARAYHDVIVQLSNSATFASGVTTVFNNDLDNSAGQGTGSQAEYAETSSGKTVTFAPVNARYARFWSSGNTVPGNVGNHTIELEVWN